MVVGPCRIAPPAPITRHQQSAPGSTPLQEKLGVTPTLGEGRLAAMARGAGGVASIANVAEAGALSAPTALRWTTWSWNVPLERRAVAWPLAVATWPLCTAVPAAFRIVQRELVRSPVHENAGAVLLDRPGGAATRVGGGGATRMVVRLSGGVTSVRPPVSVRCTHQVSTTPSGRSTVAVAVVAGQVAVATTAGPAGRLTYTSYLRAVRTPELAVQVNVGRALTTALAAGDDGSEGAAAASPGARSATIAASAMSRRALGVRWGVVTTARC